MLCYCFSYNLQCFSEATYFFMQFFYSFIHILSIEQFVKALFIILFFLTVFFFFLQRRVLKDLVSLTYFSGHSERLLQLSYYMLILAWSS